MPSPLFERYNGGKFKFENDAYYTPPDLALKLINKTYEVIGKENITEIIEPSCGNGSFSNQIPNCIAFDLYPVNDTITKQDFLKYEVQYKDGRLIIGNPPFGRSSMLARAFIKKANMISEHYAFILPASFILNRQNLHILYSEHLGEVVFNNPDNTKQRKVNCSFIIYQHIPKISYPLYKLSDIKIFEIRNRNTDIDITNPNNYDFKFIRWGSGDDLCTIKTNQDEFTHSIKMYCYIKVYNQQLKNTIYNILLNLKQELMLPRINKKLFTGAPSIQCHETYKYLLEHIPELK